MEREPVERSAAVQAELDQALTLLAGQPELGTRARSKRVGNARVVELVRRRNRLFHQLVVAKRQVLVVHVRHEAVDRLGQNALLEVLDAMPAA